MPKPAQYKNLKSFTMTEKPKEEDRSPLLGITMFYSFLRRMSSPGKQRRKTA